MVKIQPIIVWYHVVSQIFNNITYALGNIPHTVLCKSTLMNIFIKGEFLSRIVLTLEVFLYILSKCFPKTLQSFTLLPAVFERGHCTVWWVINHVMTTAIKPTHPPTNQQTLARPSTTTQGWFVHADHVGRTQHCLSNDSKAQAQSRCKLVSALWRGSDPTEAASRRPFSHTGLGFGFKEALIMCEEYNGSEEVTYIWGSCAFSIVVIANDHKFNNLKQHHVCSHSSVGH